MMQVNMGDLQPFTGTETPLHVVPESILLKVEKVQGVDNELSVMEQKPKANSSSSYCLLCRCRQNDPSITYHRYIYLFS